MDSDSSDMKRGRVRKKSAKLREMEEFEEEERKHGTKRGAEVKVAEGLVSPPLKKPKLKQDPVTPVSTVGKADQTSKSVTVTPPKTPTSPQSDSQSRGSVIKLLLSSPVQQNTPSAAGKTSKKVVNEPVDDVSPVSTLAKKTAKGKKAGAADTEDKNLKMKFHLGSSPSVETSIEKKTKGSEKLTPLAVDTTVQSEAIGEEGSLKMKFILSPKEKTSEPASTSSGKKAVNVDKTDNQGLLSILKGASTSKALVGKKAKKPKTDSESHASTSADSKPKSSEKEKVPSGLTQTEKAQKSPVKRKLEQTVVVKTNPSSSVEYALPADHNLDYMDLSSFDFDDNGDLVIAEDNKTKKLKKTANKTPKKTKTPPTAPPAANTANENEFSLDDSQLASSDVAELAKRVKTAAEKKLGKKVKKVKSEKEEAAPQKEKKKRPPTAYMLWCNSYRHKVVLDNPGADFAQISKTLGEIWQGLPEKEKLSWKNKAKKNAGKGSTLISTGKTGGSRTGPPPQVASHNHTSGATSTTTTVKTLVPVTPKPKPAADDPLSPIKGFGTEPVDVAAHLKLVGESLCIIGVRLQEHRGLIAVQGSLSVLLDSMLCACGPLMCLTQQLPEMNGCPSQVHAKTLDNVAYIMPGL